MADGSITFSTALDNSDLEKQLKRAEKSVDSLKRKIEAQEDKKSLIEKQMERGEAAIHETERAIDGLKAKMAELDKAAPNPVTKDAALAEQKAVKAELSEQEKLLKSQVKAQDALNEKWQQANDTQEMLTAKLDKAKVKELELGSAAQQASAKSSGMFSRATESIKAKFASTASMARQTMANVANGAAAPWERFGRRVNTMLRKVFIFGVILAGLRAIKSSLSSMMKENEQFNASVANLKAVLGGFLAAVVKAVLPALTMFINTVSAIFERIASLIDMIFGTNIVGFIEQQRQMAQATDDQAEAAHDLAKEQKEANRQLMAFDEINAMSDSDPSDSGAGVSSGGGGGGVAALAGDLGIFKGFFDWLDGIWERIANDTEGPFARIREGLGLIKQGFNEIIEGITSGNWALAWKGVGDIVIGVLYTIEGAFGTFMDWLDEITGGRFSGIFQGMAEIVHGFVEVVEGLLRGDLELIVQGLLDMIDGVFLFVKGIIDSLAGLLSMGVDACVEFVKGGIASIFDALGDMFPELREFFQTAKAIVLSYLDMIGGVVKSVINGVAEVITNVLNGIQQVIGGVLDIIAGIFTLDGERIFHGVLNVIEGISNAVSGFITGFINIIVGAASAFHEFIVGICENIGGALSMLGQGWSYSIPQITIPYLAQGAVIPPNREFLAVLGDQTNGRNLEAPEGLIRQIVREEAMGALLNAAPQGGDVILTLVVDGETLARAVSKGNASLARRGHISTQVSFA